MGSHDSQAGAKRTCNCADPSGPTRRASPTASSALPSACGQRLTTRTVPSGNKL